MGALAIAITLASILQRGVRRQRAIGCSALHGAVLLATSQRGCCGWWWWWWAWEEDGKVIEYRYSTVSSIITGLAIGLSPPVLGKEMQCWEMEGCLG